MGQAIDLDRYRAGQDGFRSALCNEEGFASVLGQNRQASPAEIKRQVRPGVPIRDALTWPARIASSSALRMPD